MKETRNQAPEATLEIKQWPRSHEVFKFWDREMKFMESKLL